MPDHDIISEFIGHMMAGTRTTSTSITYLFWELSRRPDIMKKRQAKFDEVIPDCKFLADRRTEHQTRSLASWDASVHVVIS